ncbi:Asp23/Gls24 family envelope stress response protein [Streptomyces xanthii]|uniref:Asp23/Gls24 family envelope stress response protein n=1 Tax=Streptomyces xanthii TaxID=2768069 RepID=A0A7H1BE29_9ACTN|nr:Asp23/Gls24 family envelope stress response protein [Streptomyces xanthii]QNS06984.1 Asp23/Gls24 family envelope stress response protein [Streptomyces xanthii]
MTADHWTQAVRQHLGLGRLLPLGGPGDGAWIAEPAAGAVLRRSVDDLPGLRLGALRLSLADTGTAYEAGVPAPPSALPPGPLRIVAECAAAPDEPLPGAAGRLRTALARAADSGLGLVVAEIDVRVTELLEPGATPASARREQPRTPEEKPPPGADTSGGGNGNGDAGRVADAARAVPGVARLTGALGGLGRPVHIEERAQGRQGEAALPRRHVRVELAVARGARALDVARAVREAVTTALPDRPTVAVLVTESAD